MHISIIHKVVSIVILLTILFAGRFAIADVVPVVINEILASNDEQLEDPDEPGEFPDWLELYNKSANEINLSNMYLSDSESNLTKWKIPANTIINAYGFLLFYAADDDEQGNAHTNFKLNRENGFIALIDTDGFTVIDSFSYKNQTEDISYGRFPDGNRSFKYFEIPSPNSKNMGGYIGEVAEVIFGKDRGFYDQPIEVTLTTTPIAAKIYYSIDGSEPSENVGNGTFLYANPVSISTTTSIRAKAVLNGWKSTQTLTHTYIFLDDVIRQPKNPEGFPNNWGHTGAGDYEMDPDVVNDPAYSAAIKDDMKSVPTVSLVMDVDDWFGENGQGIYLKGELDERAVSAELINPDGSPGFQINCAVMIFGGGSVNRWFCDKLSMRLKLKSHFGESKLQYPLFGDEATDEFDTIVLDARMCNSWAYGGNNPVSERGVRQNDVAQYTRDQFAADLQNEMGGFAPHGRYVHLYLSGLYWGIYCLHERPDEHFAAAYFGGEENEYDVVKHKNAIVVNGSNVNYRQMFSIARSGLSSEEQFNRIQEYLDIPNFIDYMIVNFYIGNVDWAYSNWYASRHRTDPSHRWRFHSWDAEHSIEGLSVNVTGKDDVGGSTFLHQKLASNLKYRKMFGDRLYQLTTNDGELTPTRLKTLYMNRLNDVDRAVVGESARWGDNRRGVPYTRDVEWINEREWMLNTYLEKRTAVLINQLKQRGLYPSINPPVFYIDGTQHAGGIVKKGDQLSMNTSFGSIFYTIDGSDPYTASDPVGKNEFTLVSKNASKRVIVPKSYIKLNWRIDTQFDDSSWKLCQGYPGGIGYERSHGYENLIVLDVEDDMHDSGGNPNPSCYIRILFNDLADKTIIFYNMTLNVRYDDGFVAYLNGEKIAGAKAPAYPQWNSSASGSHEALAVESFDVSQFLPHLKDGRNLLAIHGMNDNTSSPDFLITAELKVNGEISGSNLSPGTIEYNAPIVVNETMKIKARTKYYNNWSALREVDFLVSEDLSDLEITEIHYHPLTEGNASDREFEFIELKNVGNSVVNLSLCEFVDGVSYTFPANTKLKANEYIVLASNNEFFNQRYSIDAFDEFEGNLDNSGEKITLVDALGDTLISLRYNDKAPWPSSADGDGYSLTSINRNPDGDPNEASYWSASTEIHGSPGRRDPLLGIDHDGATLLENISLFHNYPNPFNPSTTIRFYISKETHVSINAYNINGELIKEICNDKRSTGNHSIKWDASENSSGTYFIKMTADGYSKAVKCILIK